jgi:hypothetical protein
VTRPVTFEVEVDSDAVAVEVQPTQVVSVSPSPTENVLVLAVPGTQGPRGYPGTGARIYGEHPDDPIDGANKVFTVIHEYQATTVVVFLNGLREDGFIESGPARITMTDAPLPGDIIAVDYLVA